MTRPSSRPDARDRVSIFGVAGWPQVVDGFLSSQRSPATNDSGRVSASRVGGRAAQGQRRPARRGEGQDPAAAKAEDRRAETFADLAREDAELHAKFKRSGREDLRLLYGSPHKRKTGERPHEPIVKRWGAMRAKDITRRDVRALLDEVAARAPIMANRTLALVRKMFNFAIDHSWLETNPCIMIKRLAPDRQRDRVLHEEEVRRFWAALDAEKPIIAALFRLGN